VITVLNEVPISDGWRVVPFRGVAKKVSEAGFPDLEPLSVFLDAGVVPRSSRDDNHNQLGESLDKYQRVLPNDLVFNKLRTWQGGFGISQDTGIVSPAYIIARPNQAIVSPRFLGYLLKSRLYLAELTRLSKWMPPTQFDISWESIRDLKLRIPPLENQNAIASYLDSKIPKIEMAVANYSKQLELARELFSVLVESFTSAILNPADESVPLRRVCKVDPVTDISNLSDSEVTFLGLEDVQAGNLANFESVRSIEEVRVGYSRFLDGDILVPKVSPSFGHGRAVVARELISSVGFASTEIFTIRANVAGDNDYICASMRARDFLVMGEFSYQGVAGVKRVDKEVIMDWKIRWPEVSERLRIVESIAKAQKNLEELERKTTCAISSLIELRASLIQSATLGIGVNNV